MLRQLVLALFVTLVMGGQHTPSLSNEYMMFLHFLSGAGTPVTKVTNGASAGIREVCEEPARLVVSKGDKWLVYAHGYGGKEDHSLSWSLGHFWCHKDGTITDTYDFAYQGRDIQDRKGFLIDLWECTQIASPQNKGRCLVTRDYGKPYAIEVDVGPLKNPSHK